MGKHAKVSAAEAYARDGENRPRCKCHGELMGWRLDASCLAGGYYFCVVKKLAYQVAGRAANPEKARAYYAAYYAANREKRRAYKADWRSANPDSRKDYYAANREKVNAKNAAYRAANPEKVRACRDAYRAANPEKVRAWTNARYYKMKSLGLCVKCGDVSITEVFCWKCANKRAIYG